MNLAMLKTVILNQPEGEDYLSDRQLEAFGKHFDSRLAELSVEINDKKKESQNIELVHADPVDKAEAQAELDSVLLRIRQLETEQKNIHLATKRIETGDFGYCISCGGEIGLPRLLFNPCCLRDTECHSLYEIKQKQKGLPVY